MPRSRSKLAKGTALFTDIHIKFIPKSEMRTGWDYGDYFIDDQGALQVRVSTFQNPDFAFYIAIHEIMEAWRYAKQHGPDFSAIDSFDLAHQDSDEPGRLLDAPYHAEHMLSEAIERLLCRQDGYKWSTYYNTTPLEAPPCP
jgi:hypothetical protein